ncbi:MAG: histidine kinase, partial [Lachnospiraceae bacterium]|nr:histidine kinase [Lachnospiraceae bacterium]
INVSVNAAYQSEIKKLQQFVIVFAVMSGLLATFIIIITIRYLMNNINVVVDNMNLVEKGDTDVRIDINPKMPKEVATIAEHLNRMLDKLQYSMDNEKLLAERERVAEIAALEARINPHFLYNTLDTINWMAIDNNEIEISNAISALGKILRYGINDSNGIVTIATEMEWLKQYIHLQQIRLKDTFEFSIDVEPEVLRYNIHKLLLQPFVENSIIHGFANKKGIHRLSITIRQSDMLEISIHDNGGGMKKEQVDMINSGQFRYYDDKYHIGMENAFQRIRLYYGEQANVYVVSETGKSTTVYIRLPKEEV